MDEIQIISQPVAELKEEICGSLPQARGAGHRGEGTT